MLLGNLWSWLSRWRFISWFVALFILAVEPSLVSATSIADAILFPPLFSEAFPEAFSQSLLLAATEEKSDSKKGEKKPLE